MLGCKKPSKVSTLIPNKLTKSVKLHHNPGLFLYPTLYPPALRFPAIQPHPVLPPCCTLTASCRPSHSTPTPCQVTSAFYKP